MIDTKTILIAQLFISCIMAFLMTGIFGFVALGPTPEWLAHWVKSFAMAWPVAFLLSLVVSRIGFKLAGMVTGKAV